MAETADSTANGRGVSVSSPPKPPASRRARVACKACHSRRVKCDVAEGQPCWHCRNQQVSCELIESKRGKYVRTRPRQTRNQASGSRQSRSSAGPESHPPPAGSAPVSVSVSDPVPEVSGPAGSLDGGSREEGPEMLYARIAESPRDGQQHQAESGRTYYLGDSFSLTFIVNTVSSPMGGQPHPGRLHFPIPPTVSDRHHDSLPGGVEYSAPIRDALVMPSQEVCDQLVHVFFDTIHPAWPVFDRQSFTSEYRRGQASPLVLHTIFMLAFTVSSDSLVQQAGYSDRGTARRTHYLRAKTLYDADYENDRFKLVATLFLLGFWWAGPEDQKDTWHWLGAAISLAQTLGMHRSTSQSGMSQRTQSLWKRIWWSIYVRDRQAAAALGRPCRIRDEHCDIEMLSEGDFHVDDGNDVQLVPRHQDFHTSYVIEMSKLAILLGEILLSELSARPCPTAAGNHQALAEKLVDWEQKLPFNMRQTPLDHTLGSPFWANMLHACYHNCQILLFRPQSVDRLSSAEMERDQKTRSAADAITRIAEDLLTAESIRFGQLHLVPALFAALSIHAIGIRHENPIRRQLAENRSRQCMLALSELAKSWPVASWVLHLFKNLVSRLTTQSSGPGGTSANVNPEAVHENRIMAAPVLYPSSHTRDHTPGSRPARDGHDKMPTPESVGTFEPVDQSLRNLPDPTFQNQHGLDYMNQSANQLVSDAVWASYLDCSAELDFLLHHNVDEVFGEPFMQQ